MKKLFNHPVALQMLCVILMIVSVNLFLKTKAQDEFFMSVLEENMSSAVYALEEINETIMGIYVSGKVDESVQIDVRPIYDMSSMNYEASKVLNAEDNLFRWHDLAKVQHAIRDMKKLNQLSEEDLSYLLDVHNEQQQVIDAYYETLDAYGIDEYINHDEEKYVKDIYKDFISKVSAIGISKLSERNSAFDVVLVDNNETSFKPVMTKEDAEILAYALHEKITGKVGSYQCEESLMEYEFDSEWNVHSDDDAYDITIDKETGDVNVHLSAWSGEGQYSEERIEAVAKTYIEQLVPQTFVLYDRSIRMDDNKIDSIDYEFIYYNGVYYDERQEITLRIGSQGKLERYNYSMKQTPPNIPLIVDVDAIERTVKTENLEDVVLVFNRQNKFEYQVYVVQDDVMYTLYYDALTGEQEGVLRKSKVYSAVIELCDTLVTNE